MLSERLQILVSRDQRRRLEAEADRRGKSVGSLVREAVDERYGTIAREERLRALSEIRAMQGTFLSPTELSRLGEAEAEEELEGLPVPPRSG